MWVTWEIQKSTGHVSLAMMPYPKKLSTRTVYSGPLTAGTRPSLGHLLL
jgi:hypothetical protein